MEHNLKDFKHYPTVHRWIVNRDVFSITSNTVINHLDILVVGEKKFLVLSNYRNEKEQESTPQDATRENVEDKNLMFISNDSTYYEFLTQQLV
jgi:hypothetical protein